MADDDRITVNVLLTTLREASLEAFFWWVGSTLALLVFAGLVGFWLLLASYISS